MLVREIDTQKFKKSKFADQWMQIDLEVRNTFYEGAGAGTSKCAIENNYCRLRNNQIDQDLVGSDCSWYNREET